ncbi:MAG: hypothetical protein LBR17_07935 [Bacteroidales bacterium]|jgi:hypothetical protein|nr:hypothetical protein [Bacteroidales bacterium]
MPKPKWVKLIEENEDCEEQYKIKNLNLSFTQLLNLNQFINPHILLLKIPLLYGGVSL